MTTTMTTTDANAAAPCRTARHAAARRAAPACAAALALALAAGLSGCSTPQAAIDQAKQGVSLSEQLRGELLRYQRNVGIAAKGRLATITRTEEQIAKVKQNGELSAFLEGKTGMSSELAAKDLLNATAQAYARSAATREQARQELATRLNTLLKDLPSPSEKLVAVEKAMAELGAELSPQERVKVLTAFVADAKKLADANAASADKAAATSATEP